MGRVRPAYRLIIAGAGCAALVLCVLAFATPRSSSSSTRPFAAHLDAVDASVAAPVAIRTTPDRLGPQGLIVGFVLTLCALAVLLAAGPLPRGAAARRAGPRAPPELAYARR
jgi:hypothetical protein